MNLSRVEALYTSYGALKDSVRIARRSIRRSGYALHARTQFAGLEVEEASRILETAAFDLNDLVVLGLVANLERALRDFLEQSAEDVHRDSPHPLSIPVADLTQDAIERRPFSDIIDLFGQVSEEIRGPMKQVIQYRNWIAHGRNSDRPPPVRADPEGTIKLIQAFIASISRSYRMSPP